MKKKTLFMLLAGLVFLLVNGCAVYVDPHYYDHYGYYDDYHYESYHVGTYYDFYYSPYCH